LIILVNMKKKVDKRDKMSEEEIATRLFELFQDKKSYTLQELNNLLNQPKVYFNYQKFHKFRKFALEIFGVNLGKIL